LSFYQSHGFKTFVTVSRSTLHQTRIVFTFRIISKESRTKNSPGTYPNSTTRFRGEIVWPSNRLLWRVNMSSNRGCFVVAEDFVAHGANVNCLALGHKSGRVLVTGGDDKKVNLWAVGTHNCIMVRRYSYSILKYAYPISQLTHISPKYLEWNSA